MAEGILGQQILELWVHLAPTARSDPDTGVIISETDNGYFLEDTAAL